MLHTNLFPLHHKLTSGTHATIKPRASKRSHFFYTEVGNQDQGQGQSHSHFIRRYCAREVKQYEGNGARIMEVECADGGKL